MDLTAASESRDYKYRSNVGFPVLPRTPQQTTHPLISAQQQSSSNKQNGDVFTSCTPPSQRGFGVAAVFLYHLLDEALAGVEIPVNRNQSVPWHFFDQERPAVFHRLRSQHANIIESSMANVNHQSAAISPSSGAGMSRSPLHNAVGLLVLPRCVLFVGILPG